MDDKERLANELKANLTPEAAQKMNDVLEKWKDYVDQNKVKLQEQHKNFLNAYNAIKKFYDNYDGKKADLAKYCLEQCEMSIYDSREFLDFTFDLIEKSKGTEDKTEFFKALIAEWKKFHSSGNNVIYEAIKSKKYSNKLNSKTVNSLASGKITYKGKTKELNLIAKDADSKKNNKYDISKKLKITGIVFYAKDFLNSTFNLKSNLPYKAILVLNAITTAELILKDYKAEYGFIFISWNDFFKLLHYPTRKDGTTVYTQKDIDEYELMLEHLHGIKVKYSVPHPLISENGMRISLTGGYIVEWNEAEARRADNENDDRTVKGFVVKSNAALDEVKALAQLSKKGMELIQIPLECYDIKKAENVVFEKQIYKGTKERFDAFKSADLTTKKFNMDSKRRVILEYVLKEIFTEYAKDDHKLYVGRALQAAEIDEKDNHRSDYVKFIETVLINLTLHGHIKYGFNEYKSYRKTTYFKYFKTKKFLEADQKNRSKK